MSSGSHSTHVRFPEIKRLLIHSGKSKFDFAKDAGTSRNTLDKMLAGGELRTTTVTGILTQLSKNGHDTTEASALLMERLGAIPGQARSISSGGSAVALAVDNNAQNANDFAKLAISNLELAEQYLFRLETQIKGQGSSDVSQDSIDDIEYLQRRLATVVEGVVRYYAAASR